MKSTLYFDQTDHQFQVMTLYTGVIF